MKFAIIASLAASVAAYKANDKIAIDLYYESQCPGCREQVTSNFKTALATPGFTDMAEVTLHPYGNARETAGADGQWNFQCQHGAAECVYNQMEVCAQNYNANIISTGDMKMQSFNFIACIEGNDSNTNYEANAKKCASATGQSGIEDILTCMNGK
jgi:hypothetical protein